MASTGAFDHPWHDGAHFAPANGLLRSDRILLLPALAFVGNVEGKGRLGGDVAQVPCLLGGDPIGNWPCHAGLLSADAVYQGVFGAQYCRKDHLRACHQLVHQLGRNGIVGGSRVLWPQRELLGAQSLQAQQRVRWYRHHRHGHRCCCGAQEPLELVLDRYCGTGRPERLRGQYTFLPPSVWF